MVIAIDPREEFEFVASCDRHLPEDDPNRTVWLLRPLSRRERNLLQDYARQDSATGEVNPRAGSVMEDTIRAGLTGWRNLRKPDGTEIVCSKSKKLNVLGKTRPVVDDELLDKIPPPVLLELACEIQDSSNLTVAEGNG
jgi:hypothetical protein